MSCRRKILLVIGLLTFSCITTQAQPQKITGDKIVAAIGDHIILYSDIKNSADDLRRQGIVESDAICQLIEQAIIDKLLLLQAERDSLIVTNEEVEAELDQRLRAFINQGEKSDIDSKTIAHIKDKAREPIRERRMAEAMLEKITAAVKITPAETKTFFDKIPKDSLLLIESQVETGQITLYPTASPEANKYIFDELNNYKKSVENKTTTLCPLGKMLNEADNKDGCAQYSINRNDNSWDPVFMAAVFRLKKGEISRPIKLNSGIYLVQMIERTGDDAVVQCIFRNPVIGEERINLIKGKLDSVRLMVIAGSLSFEQAAAALNYNEDNIGGFTRFVTLDQLDRDMANMIEKMKPGDISAPVIFTNEKGVKGLRIIYLKSRTKSHWLNLHDDYIKISQMALEQKKEIALDKWVRNKISNSDIVIDNVMASYCPQLQKFTNTTSGGF